MTSSLVPQFPSSLAVPETDVLETLLKGRSSNTQRAYGKDLRDFFRYLVGVDELSPQVVKEFFSLSQYQALTCVLNYKAYLTKERSLAEATVNRRLAAIKSLVLLGNQLGQCSFTLAGVKGDKVIRYRDTTGISKEAYRRMLAIPDVGTLKGKRDYAILRLLWDNALRRGEISQADIKDLDLEGRCLLILVKGKGQQKTSITLSRATVEAILDWLHSRKELDGNQPLFIALDRSHYGHRLTGTAIYKLVDKIAQQAGIVKKLSPHRIRHSSVTAALDATGGDVRKVQKLSRHADLNTLMIYDDNRLDVQGEISDLLSELV